MEGRIPGRSFPRRSLSRREQTPIHTAHARVGRVLKSWSTTQVQVFGAGSRLLCGGLRQIAGQGRFPPDVTAAVATCLPLAVAISARKSFSAPRRFSAPPGAVAPKGEAVPDGKRTSSAHAGGGGDRNRAESKVRGEGRSWGWVHWFTFQESFPHLNLKYSRAAWKGLLPASSKKPPKGLRAPTAHLINPPLNPVLLCVFASLRLSDRSHASESRNSQSWNRSHAQDLPPLPIATVPSATASRGAIFLRRSEDWKRAVGLSLPNLLARWKRRRASLQFTQVGDPHLPRRQGRAHQDMFDLKPNAPSEDPPARTSSDPDQRAGH